jgi:hypothetical protein
LTTFWQLFWQLFDNLFFYFLTQCDTITHLWHHKSSSDPQMTAEGTVGAPTCFYLIRQQRKGGGSPWIFDERVGGLGGPSSLLTCFDLCLQPLHESDWRGDDVTLPHAIAKPEALGFFSKLMKERVRMIQIAIAIQRKTPNMLSTVEGNIT